MALNVSIKGGMAHPKAGAPLLCIHSWYKSAIGMQSLPLTPSWFVPSVQQHRGQLVLPYPGVLHCSVVGSLKPQMSLCQAFHIRMAKWTDHAAPWVGQYIQGKPKPNVDSVSAELIKMKFLLVNLHRCQQI